MATNPVMSFLELCFKRKSCSPRPPYRLENRGCGKFPKHRISTLDFRFSEAMLRHRTTPTFPVQMPSDRTTMSRFEESNVLLEGFELRQFTCWVRLLPSADFWQGECHDSLLPHALSATLCKTMQWTFLPWKFITPEFYCKKRRMPEDQSYSGRRLLVVWRLTQTTAQPGVWKRT